MTRLEWTELDAQLAHRHAFYDVHEWVECISVPRCREPRMRVAGGVVGEVDEEPSRGVTVFVVPVSVVLVGVGAVLLVAGVCAFRSLFG